MTSPIDKLHTQCAFRWTAGSCQGVGTAGRLIRASKESLNICINVTGYSTGMWTEDNDGSSLLYSFIVLPSPPAIRATICIMQCKIILTEFSLLAPADSFCLLCCLSTCSPMQYQRLKTDSDKTAWAHNKDLLPIMPSALSSVFSKMKHLPSSKRSIAISVAESCWSILFVNRARTCQVCLNPGLNKVTQVLLEGRILLLCGTAPASCQDAGVMTKWLGNHLVRSNNNKERTA